MKKETKKELKKIPLFDSTGKKADTIDLDKDIFTGKVNTSLLYQAVTMYRANKRRGSASTKRRGEVSGGGKKPWRQKGTGRARVASSRNPIWRGGGIAFGPHPRDFGFTMPKKMRENALISSLNAKIKNGQILVLENIDIKEPKTKLMTGLLKKMKITNKALLLTDVIDKKLNLASRNVKNLTVKKVNEATALDVLSSDQVVITKAAASELIKKVKK